MPIDVETLRTRLCTALGDSLQLGELLGAGGFAAVFRAHDPFLERDVAIKVLDPALGLSADLFILKVKGQPSDTLYRNMSGTESTRLLTELGAWNRGTQARAAARDSMAK